MKSPAAALTLAIAVGGATFAAGSSGATTAPSTATPSPPAAATAPLYPSFDAFVWAWNEMASALTEDDPSRDIIPLDAAEFVTAPLAPDGLLGPGTAFAARLRTDGYVGGIIDPSGSVVGVMVGGNPAAHVTYWSGLMIIFTLTDPASLGGGAVFAAWDQFVGNSNYVVLESDYVAGDGVGLYLRTGDASGSDWVTLVAARAQGEPAASDHSSVVSRVVASVATIATPATTAPAATTVPVTAPTTTPPPATTALPTISLAPPGVTAPPFTTAVPPSTVPLTTAAPVPGALFASIYDLIARWNEQAAVTAAASGQSPLTLDDSRTALVIGTGPAGSDIFGMQFAETETALLGGIAQTDGGPVEALALLLNPFAPTSLDAVTTAGHLVAEEVFPQYLTMYTEMITAGPDEHRYLVDGDHDIAIVIIDFPRGGQAVVVSVAPVTDEATAVTNAEELAEAISAALTLLS